VKDPIENALEKMKPVELPASLMARLTAVRPQPVAAGERPSLLRRWLLPLASGACAALATVAVLKHLGAPATPAPAVTATAKEGHFESDGYLMGARNVGVVVGADQRAYRIVELEWLERNTVRPHESGPGVRVETMRRGVVPVALDIY
jgi:hypothetical protein